MLSASFLVQVIAALSIPVALVTVAFARVTVQKPIRTKDMVLATEFAIVPAILVIAVRGILPWWGGGLGLVFVALLAFIQGTNTN